MSHFGFVCPPLSGHVNPMRALAETLVRRGHTATFFGLADMAGAIGTAEIGFLPIGARTHPPGTLAAITRHLADPRGLKLFRVLHDAARMTDMLCREAPEAFRSAGIDAVVADQLEPAGGLVAMHLGLPFVSVANALPINRDDALPPPFVDWRFDPSEAGIRRNRGGYRVADLMMVEMTRVIARHAARLDLAPRRTIEACLSPLAQLSQMVPGLDFPRRQPSPALQACGPFRTEDPPDRLAGLPPHDRPLIFASLGTLQGGRIEVFRRIAAACHALDLDLVIAHGGRLSEDDIATLPGQPVVRSFVEQRPLLRRVALAITNGGLNTVLDALAVAVPVLVIPIAFEQGAIGARLTYRGAGAALPLRRLSVQTLQKQIEAMLTDGGFAMQAGLIAAEIASAGGVARAASVVETVVGTRDAVGQADLAGAA